jgi:hypothetical protein
MSTAAATTSGGEEGILAESGNNDGQHDVAPSKTLSANLPHPTHPPYSAAQPYCIVILVQAVYMVLRRAPPILKAHISSSRSYPLRSSFCWTSPYRAMSTSAPPPVEILLVGLGSIGSVYAYLLEKVSSAPTVAPAV